MSFYMDLDLPVAKEAKAYERADFRRAEEALWDVLGDDKCQSAWVGSSAVLGKGNDLDVCLLSTERTIHDAAPLLEAAGYVLSQDDDYELDEDTFACFRKGDVNVMLTDNENWFYAFVEATKVCQTLKIKKKWKRIAVHRLLMDLESPKVARRKAKEACK